MKNFTQLDVSTLSRFPRIYTDHTELIESPLWYHKRGLMQTRSGYGKKLNSGLKISFEGKLYRIYTTIYGNSGSCWFICKGVKIYVG